MRNTFWKEESFKWASPVADQGPNNTKRFVSQLVAHRLWKSAAPLKPNEYLIREKFLPGTGFWRIILSRSWSLDNHRKARRNKATIYPVPQFKVLILVHLAKSRLFTLEARKERELEQRLPLLYRAVESKRVQIHFTIKSSSSTTTFYSMRGELDWIAWKKNFASSKVIVMSFGIFRIEDFAEFCSNGRIMPVCVSITSVAVKRKVMPARLSTNVKVCLHWPLLALCCTRSPS